MGGDSRNYHTVATPIAIVRPRATGDGGATLEVTIPKMARQILDIDKNSQLLVTIEGKKLVFAKGSIAKLKR